MFSQSDNDTALREKNESSNLIASKPGLPVNLAFAASLPPEARSVLYEREYYNKYLAITLKTLRDILSNSSCSFLRNPILFYCGMDYMNGFLYAVDFQFEDPNDEAINTTVLERGKSVPTWIISLRQQLDYTDVLRIDPENSQQYRLFIDFRRILPPHWVKEKKVSHLLDNVIDVRPLIRQQFQEMSDSLNENQAKLNSSPGTSVVKAKTIMTRPTIPTSSPHANTTTPKPQPKSQSIRDVFARLVKQQPAATPASASTTASAPNDPMDVEPSPEAILLEKHLMDPNAEGAEAWLRETFTRFYQECNETNYKNHVLFQGYQHYLRHITEIMNPSGQTETRLPLAGRAFLHRLLVHCSEGIEALKAQDFVASEASKVRTCVLTNQELPSSNLYQLTLPTMQVALSKEKFKLINTMASGCTVLGQTIKEKTAALRELTKQPPSSNHPTLTKICQQWLDVFIMTVKLFHRFVLQLTKK